MPAQVYVDCYGRPSSWSEYQNEAEAPAAYQVDAATEGVSYIRYHAAAECAVQRVTTAGGLTTREWAFGAWADRAILQYQEINAPLLVDADKVWPPYRNW